MDMVPGEYQDSVKIGEQRLDSEFQPKVLSGQNKKALRESLHEGLSLGEPAGARTQDTRIKSLCKRMVPIAIDYVKGSVMGILLLSVSRPTARPRPKCGVNSPPGR